MKRSEVRNAIVESLKGKTIAGNRVFKNRSTQMARGQLPAINIYTRDEDVEIFQQAPRINIRTLKVAIEIAVENKTSDTDSLDDILDDFAEQIENVMDRNEDLEDEIHEIRLINVNLNLISEGTKPVAGGMLDYEVDYLKEQAVDDSEFGEFKKINIAIETDGDDDPESEDEITLPQT